MENNGKNIDDLFRSGLGDYAESPPPAVWDRLEKKLDGVPKRTPTPYYRWLGYFGMVSLLLLLGVSVGRNMMESRSYDLKTSNIAKNPATSQTMANQDDHIITAKNTASGHTTNNVTGAKNTTDADEKEQTSNTSNLLATSKLTTSNTHIHKMPAGKKLRPANRQNNSSNSRLATAARNRNNSRKSSTEPEDDHVYHSGNIGASGGPSANENIASSAPAQAKAPVSAAPATKTLPVVANKNVPAKKEQKIKPYFPRFELGVKAGYETGFNNEAAKKAVVSPYVQYNISQKWAVMLQPAVKSAFLSSRLIGAPEPYYKVNNDGKLRLNDSIGVYDGTDGAGLLWMRNYSYTQTHDSIVKLSSIGGTYIEFEVPVLLKYNVGKKCSMYGGVNLIYSKLINVTEQTNTTQLTRTNTFTVAGGYNQPAPAVPSADSAFIYSGKPISSYTGPQFPTTQTSMLRCGYMIGFTYQYDRRWLFDALLQQASAPTNVQAGYNINSALSSAYLRLSIGYKLTK